MRNLKVSLVAAIAGALMLGVTGCGAGPYRGPDGQVTATASVGLSDLKVGDCIYNVSNLGDQVTSMQVVPCSSSHEGEVYATESNVANSPDDITNFCTDQFAIYIGLDFNSSALSAKFFHNADASSNTDVQCVVFASGQMVTTSYKDSNQ